MEFKIYVSVANVQVSEWGCTDDFSGLRRRISGLHFSLAHMSQTEMSVYTVHATPKTNDLAFHLVKVPKDNSYLV